MTFRFLAPLPDGTLADVTVEAMFLSEALEQFKESNPGRGWYAVWCELRLAGYVRVDEKGAELVDLKTDLPSHANPFACGD